MSFFDFNLFPPFCRHSTAFQLVLEAADESWPNRFLSARGFAPDLPVSTVCPSVSRQSLRQGFLLLGSVPFSGLRSTHLSRKSPRYRSLSARPATQTVSHGFPRPSLPQYVGARQRASRLAHLRRLRSHPDCHRPRPVPRRTVRRGVVRDRLRPGLHHHRFMSGAFSLGKIPPPQERRETAHAAGSARPHSDQCLCDRRPSSRRQYSGSVASRNRRVLLAGSRVCGLRSPASIYPSLRVLHYARPKRDAVLPARLAPRRTIRRAALRPNHSVDRSAHGPALPRSLTAHPLLRCRERLAPDVPDQQFSASRFDHRPTVSRALASGIILSLDQTAPTHQGFLRHLRKRREDAGLGGCVGVCAGRYCQKTTGAGPEPLQNIADSQCHRFRENPHSRRVFQLQRRVPGRRILHAIESIRLLMGQHCFGITLISASIAHFARGDARLSVLFIIDPLFFFSLLIVSYFYFEKSHSILA